MAVSTRQGGFSPSGFFVFRSPLLPWDTLSAWGSGLDAARLATADQPERLTAAWNADCALLRRRLAELLGRPEVREAVFLASPDLESQVDSWMADPVSEKGRRVEQALVRYLARMAGRATPFGLFAGGATGVIAEGTSLTTEGLEQYQRHTRLDMDYLHSLSETLGQETELRRHMTYRPNSSLYRVGHQLHYAEARLSGRQRTYHLVAVEAADYLERTLTRAAAGARPDHLALALAGEIADVTQEEATAYIDQLIDSQILLPDLMPPVTGPEAIHSILAALGSDPAAAPLVQPIEAAQRAMLSLDAGGLGASPDRYRALAGSLAALPVTIELQRLFQVDMTKPAPRATLGPKVIAEISRGAELLQRLAQPYGPGPLTRFCEAFRTRYESREVPLVEVLDEESGIGLATGSAPAGDGSPLLKGLIFPATEQARPVWSPLNDLLLQKVTRAIATGADEIRIEPEEVSALAAGDPPPLPNAFAVRASLAAPSEEALARGEFRLCLESASGPSGARLLGRFCHADPRLHQHVIHHLQAEEALNPEAVFAEIIHLPEGRVGNVLARPVLRAYEIPYLGRSGAPGERQIPIDDLLISVVGDQIRLRSRRLGRRVIPRLSTAHNYTTGSLGIYRFLCLLQGQGVAGDLVWDWGPLSRAPFLPRLVSGRLVLAPARWRAGKKELQLLAARQGSERFQAVQAWRAERRLPRIILLADGDNRLPVDLENPLLVDTFIELVKSRDAVVLLEMLPSPDELIARGPEGRFVHDLIIPFVRARSEAGARTNTPTRPSPAPAVSHPLVPRRFVPGSEWMYVKLYTGTATADQVLRELVRPVVRKALGSGAADRWHFIRYADPDRHIRLRLHGHPGRLLAEVLADLQATAAPLLDEGSIWRVQLDTYEREVERYGGSAGIELSEAVFHADSEAVLTMVEHLSGDEGADARWRLALAGMNQLLADLGLDLPDRLSLARQRCTAYRAEFRADGRLKGQIGDRFRSTRNELQDCLNPEEWADSPLAPGLAALRERSARLAPVCAELASCRRNGRLSVDLVDLAASYLHMHANRLLRSAERAHELVLYDLLARHYESRTARMVDGR